MARRLASDASLQSLTGVVAAEVESALENTIQAAIHSKGTE
jgi:hypothetical protein